MSYCQEIDDDIFEECFALESSLDNIIDQKTLKWVFVGGKGGVGKTTCSCSLAIRLAQVRSSVLIISTDPAHNLSDAFNQKLLKIPTKVKGFDNLYAMEVDPNFIKIDDYSYLENENFSIGKGVIHDLVGSLPGINETLCFAEVIKLVQNMSYSVVVFDTAPTGHTLKLLSFPKALEKNLAELLKYKTKLGPFINHISSFIPSTEFSSNTLTNDFEDILSVIKLTNMQFQDKAQTTFICVCTAEYLSIYETERLIQELTKVKIDTHNIIVNQIWYPPYDTKIGCKLCKSRYNLQTKYLDQIEDLYEDFHITRIPLLENEIRGTDQLLEFSKHLFNHHEENNNNLI